MIIDSSVVVAVLTRERDGLSYRDVIYDAGSVRFSAAGYVEVGIVLDSRGLGPELDLFLGWCQAQVEPVTAAHAHLARLAYRRYGRGSGHPARLNFGDCFSYALAVDRGEPLLFKGDDFVHTDVLIAR